MTVNSADGCSTTKEVTVTVTDVRGGANNSGIKMCFQGKPVIVAPYLVPTYQRYGGAVGPCNNAPARLAAEEARETVLTLTVKAYPNPTTGALTVQVNSPVAGPAQLDVLDVAGRAVQQRTQQLSEGLNELEFNLGSQTQGTYLIRCRDVLGRQAVVRVQKQ